MLETSNVVLKYTHICSFHDLHMTWNYKRFFKCDSKKILNGLICDNCDIFYIGEIEELKQRTWKHKSNVSHPNNSGCKKCTGD